MALIYTSPENQKNRIKKNKLFEDLTRHKSNRTYEKELAENPEKYVMLVRPWMGKVLDRIGGVTDARYAYSMWGGYLQNEIHEKFQRWLDERNIPMRHIHMSGHASARDLRKFAEALAPKNLVPIHSFEAARFAEEFANVTLKYDGEWWGM